MPKTKLAIIVSFLMVISIHSFCQSKKSLPRDTIGLTSFLNKARKNLVTTDSIAKITKDKNLTTLKIYYGPKTILALAKND